MSQVSRARTRCSDRFSPNKSEKTVLEVLSLSISCIAFLRGFFPEDYFEDSVFEIPETLSQKSKSDQIKIKKLKYGASDESDSLLNWISCSISDALQKKYLRSVNLCVISDKNSKNDIYESYMFDINYSDSYADSINFGDLGVSAADATKAQVFNLLKTLILQTQSLSPLPQQRYLSMQLLFADNCPKDYFPEDFSFTETTDDPPATISIPAISATAEVLNDCGKVDSVHHMLIASILSKEHLGDELDSNAKVVAFDPLKSVKEEEKETSNEKRHEYVENFLLNSQISQVTKELYSMVNYQNTSIHDGQTQIPMLEENELSIACTCLSEQYLPFSSLIYCKNCNKGMHRVCYSIPSGPCKFLCHNCQTSHDRTIKKIKDFDFLILCNVRKLINIFMNPRLYPVESVSGLFSLLGYTDTIMRKNPNVKESITNALSILLYENIITLKSKKSFNFQMFAVDVDGILMDNQTMQTGKYYFKFNSHRNTEMNNFLNAKFGYEEEVSDTLSKMSQLADDSYFGDISIDTDTLTKKMGL